MRSVGPPRGRLFAPTPDRVSPAIMLKASHFRGQPIPCSTAGGPSLLKWGFEAPRSACSAAGLTHPGAPGQGVARDEQRSCKGLSDSVSPYRRCTRQLGAGQRHEAAEARLTHGTSGPHRAPRCTRSWGRGLLCDLWRWSLMRLAGMLGIRLGHSGKAHLPQGGTHGGWQRGAELLALPPAPPGPLQTLGGKTAPHAGPCSLASFPE